MGGALKRKEKISGAPGRRALDAVPGVGDAQALRGPGPPARPTCRCCAGRCATRCSTRRRRSTACCPTSRSSASATLLRWIDLPARHAVPPAARLARPRVRAACCSSPARRATASPPASTCRRARPTPIGALEAAFARRDRRRADRRRRSAQAVKKRQARARAPASTGARWRATQAIITRRGVRAARQRKAALRKRRHQGGRLPAGLRPRRDPGEARAGKPPHAQRRHDMHATVYVVDGARTPFLKSQEPPRPVRRGRPRHAGRPRAARAPAVRAAPSSTR